MRRRVIAVVAGVLAALLAQLLLATGAPAAVELVSDGSAEVGARFRGVSKQAGRALFVTAERLAPEDTDSSDDLYRWSGGQPELISIGPAGGNGAFGVGGSEMSADGSHVFFETFERLTTEDTDSRYDVYERTGGQTRLASIGPAGGNGNGADHDAFLLSVSADGTRVFLRTDEKLVSEDNLSDLDVYERGPGLLGPQTRLVTGRTTDEPRRVRFSYDGTRVLFHTIGREVAADTDLREDAYVFENGSLRLISTGPTGGNGPHSATAPFLRGANSSLSHIAFYTDEQLIAEDTDTSRDLYEYEYATGDTRLFFDGPICSPSCWPEEWAGVSEDGSARFIATVGGLDPADTDGYSDLYRRTASGYELMSGHEPGSNEGVQSESTYLASSFDGGRVVFSTFEHLTTDDQDSPDCNVGPDVFGCEDLYQRFGNDTDLLSGGAPTTQGFHVTFAGASSDARRVFFYTEEPLIAQDTDTSSDLYMRQSGVTSLLSIGPAGGNGAFHVCRPFYCQPPEDALSEDGNRIFFETAERLVSADADNATDVYVAHVATGYPRPKGATPTYAYLVPAYQACVAPVNTPDRTHGPPLAYASCSAPDQVSAHLTVGTHDANARPAKSVGHTRYGAALGDPATPADEANVNFYMTLSDVRVASDLSDYEGELELRFQIRITDRRSGPGANEPATVEDFDFSLTVPCAATADTTIGAHCEVATTVEAITPGAVAEGARSVWQFGRARVYDGGPDGVAATQDNTLFVVQGVFVP